MIDQLLKVVCEKGGREGALVLEPGREALLRAGAGEHPLTRSALDAAAIERLLQEVARRPLPRPAADGEPLELRHRAGAADFLILAVAGDAGWRVTARVAAPMAVAFASPAVAARVADADERPLPPVGELLARLVEARGSDLHLSSRQPPRWRIDGDLTVLPGYAAPAPETLEGLLREITPERNRRELEERNDTDFAHEIPGLARFRVNLFRDRLGPGAVMRQIPERIPTADDLGLSPAVRELAMLAKGLVLVTGPTGSGKSTTLAAIVDLVNRTRHDHIITIEDPVEFVHASRRCLVNQREVNVHTGSFKQALRAALREDPDVVLVGELRDLETISMALETAETGHLVFGTLHTTTAISTVERVVDQFPGDRQEQVRMMLADSLKAVIAQTLLKKVGGGRVAAQEILLATPAVSNLIREGKTFQLASVLQTGRAKGMVALHDALVDLVKRGVVEPREAWIKATDKEALAKAFAASGIALERPDLAA